MTVQFYAHLKWKRAEGTMLLDSRATENFMNLQYARWLGVPIKQLDQPRKLYNVDRTTNQQEELKYYTDLITKTGGQQTNLRFFLTDLGEHWVILGYPWFTAKQLKIDWARGWIDVTQLPIILRTPDTAKARFTPRSRNAPRKLPNETMFIGRVMTDPTSWHQMIALKLAEELTPKTKSVIPNEYQQ
jgi:hypothetical protein